MGMNTHFTSRGLARLGFQNYRGHATSLTLSTVGKEPTGITERAQISTVNITNARCP